jgi:hypothetical protein
MEVGVIAGKVNGEIRVFHRITKGLSARHSARYSTAHADCRVLASRHSQENEQAKIFL